MRNFIYLDSDKLRSFSSQMFEGVADFVVRSEQSNNETSAEQKGPVGSGRTLADIFKESRATTELRFLEDHAYSIFEDKISESKMIQNVTFEQEILDLPFLKVCGQTKINDTRATNALVSNFNSIGLALYTAINFQSLSEKSLGKFPSDNDLKNRAKAEGMQMDQKLLSSLSTLIEFGLNGMLEIEMTFPSFSFTAPLKREFLRENETILIQKYSRLPHKHFTVVGSVTQVKDHIITRDINNVGDQDNIKKAIRVLSEHMHSVEDAFAGPSSGEIVLDPIAVYLEF
ncbi:hypothetical protein Q4610_04360 [Sphingobium sp. HBC34]|uniref:Uncharacterized protein n=1 Tax=Sphingobium cyanobacteriorum TaxID=3063954 RepID=A0ABT8ZIL4_9SPHN|nr:hypothetical protein [Sphingobium sp. HBC34]MDO7834271.1 hypothetical protein [Sphingobium sp. HBC34]